MQLDATVMGPIGLVVGALAGAVGVLYRELQKERERASARIVQLESALDDALIARVTTAEKNTAWALALQEKNHVQVDTLSDMQKAQSAQTQQFAEMVRTLQGMLVRVSR